MLRKDPCKKCGQENQKTRLKLQNQNKTKKYYLLSTCNSCEKRLVKEHQQNNREYWRAINRKSYRNWAPEQYAKRVLESSYRHKRLRNVLWEKELTDLVTQEAHDLRRLRKQISGVDWHVDHIIPLNGNNVSGFHVWNNLQVIPASVNLSKGNREVL